MLIIYLKHFNRALVTKNYFQTFYFQTLFTLNGNQDKGQTFLLLMFLFPYEEDIFILKKY